MGQFITFEGGEGAGKTTQIRLLQKYFQQLNVPYVATREPGDTALGGLIRKILLEVSVEAVAPLTEVFLYLADRSHHVSQIILPAISAGKIVLCDRFTDSTLAYQGYGRGIDLAWLRELNNTATAFTRPHLTFLLDCPVELGLARTGGRKYEAGKSREDRFEQETIEFHEKVRAGFLALAREEPERFCIIDATKTVEETAADIREIVHRKLFNEPN
ncbi:MAG TPA: dTMP kinase [Candidatus Binatia bacterium]|jgi:dTMP kinase|nr:dTMP kinase [Candidatus Binatia bacterium]